MELLSEEYIRGLIEGEGCFTFEPKIGRKKEKVRVPVFAIGMHERDQELLRLVRTSMKLPKINSNTVYVNGPYNYNGCKNNGKIAKLIVRDYLSLKEVIVPFFYGKLRGHKGIQFREWIEKIGDKNVPYPYRHIFNLHKKGYWGNPNPFAEK